jgi:putative transposase
VEIYHLLNRGVEKRKVVLDDADRVRFIHDLYAFNDLNDVDANHRFREFESPRIREPLVDIYAFCLMPNHYHILASEIEVGGISMFMRKLNMGYAKYFNEKYDRSGVLWQGTFKRILLQRDAHFLHIPFYIHLNPLDLKFPQWRFGKVRNIDGALKFLAEYRWSSYLDYNDTKNFPSILNQELLMEVLGSTDRQKRIIADIISSASLAEYASKLE